VHPFRDLLRIEADTVVCDGEAQSAVNLHKCHAGGRGAGMADHVVQRLLGDAEQAERRMTEIAAEMLERWSCRRVAILHRTGDLSIGEIAVIVAASSAHRDEAFAACRHGIERTKQDAPIWKKEHLVGGESDWVMGS